MRNFRIIAFLLTIIPLVLIIFIGETLLRYKSTGELEFNLINKQVKRYIRLKEHTPSGGKRRVIHFTKEVLDETDSLGKETVIFGTDENGFILPSQICTDPELKIVFLGESSTECAWVEEQKRFPFLVGKMLGEKISKKVNSYNSGVSGNQSLHSINILVNKVIPMKPQVVVMMHNVNDLNTLLGAGTYWHDKQDTSTIVVEEEDLIKILREFRDLTVKYTYDTLRTLFANIMSSFQMSKNDDGTLQRISTAPIDKAALVEDFKSNLQLFIDICRNYNIEPVLMTQQNRFGGKLDKVVKARLERFSKLFGLRNEKYIDLYDSFNEAIRIVGRENNILLIDLDKKIPKDKKYMYDYVHFNDFGSEFAAGIISDELFKHIQSRSDFRPNP